MNEVEELDMTMKKEANNKEKSFKQKFEKIGKEIEELEFKLVKTSSKSETKRFKRVLTCQLWQICVKFERSCRIWWTSQFKIERTDKTL